MQCHQAADERGVIGLAFQTKEPASHLLSFTIGYLLSQTDISIHCPVRKRRAIWPLATPAKKIVTGRYLEQDVAQIFFVDLVSYSVIPPEKLTPPPSKPAKNPVHDRSP